MFNRGRLSHYRRLKKYGAGSSGGSPMRKRKVWWTLNGVRVSNSRGK